jgi:tetratricopeptide (TPR) repeat protein
MNGIGGNMALPEEWRRFAPPPRPLQSGDEWNVFLSYRSVNRAWVLNLYDVLRQQGHKVFLDQCVLKPGDDITKLEEGLSRSQSGVLIWSKASQDSEWVRREYQVLERQSSTKKGFCFVPVKLDDSPLPGFVENRIFVDFRDYPDGPNGGELLRLLHAVVGQAMSEEAVRFADGQNEAAQQALRQVGAAIRNKNPQHLKQLFDQGGWPWQTSAALACRAAEGLTKLAQDEDAVAMLERVVQQFPKAVRPKQLLALTLARLAVRTKRPEFLARAQDILGVLYESGERDPETLGIYARTWMDRYERSKDLNDLKQSRSLYAEAFDSARDDYYTGINAASKSVLIGTPEDIARGAGYASQVLQIVGDDATKGDYWQRATVGEVFLLQKDYKRAAEAYKAAVESALSETGSHTATWAQAWRLMEKLSPTLEERAIIRKAFAHLPDPPS